MLYSCTFKIINSDINVKYAYSWYSCTDTHGISISAFHYFTIFYGKKFKLLLKIPKKPNILIEFIKKN